MGSLRDRVCRALQLSLVCPCPRTPFPGHLMLPPSLAGFVHQEEEEVTPGYPQDQKPWAVLGWTLEMRVGKESPPYHEGPSP